MNSKISDKDKKDWENFLSDNESLPNKDSALKKSSNKSTDTFDLHGYTLDDANKKIKDIILFCVEKQYKEILLVTGKGSHSKNEKNVYTSKEFGKLKYSVPEFINSSIELKKLIHSINKAEPKDGGDGAIIIKLKNL